MISDLYSEIHFEKVELGKNPFEKYLNSWFMTWKVDQSTQNRILEASARVEYMLGSGLSDKNVALECCKLIMVPLFFRKYLKT